ncbi:MAG: flagellar basal body-associated FliL family protein [Deltaproteobacteria bacterium]|nr:flagellar basal body-associated FliL family protein [Deltaproteobacteria bacterium]
MMADEPEDKAKETQKSSGRGGSKTLLIIVIAGFLLFMVLAGAGFFILWKKLPAPENTKTDTSEEKMEDEKPAQLTVGPVFSLEPFIVNLADPAGNRFLRAKMTLELGNPELLEKMDKLVFPVRDKILTVLSSKKYLEINTSGGKEQLRVEIATAVDGLLGKESVKNVYFSDLVVE